MVGGSCELAASKTNAASSTNTWKLSPRRPSLTFSAPRAHLSSPGPPTTFLCDAHAPCSSLSHLLVFFPHSSISLSQTLPHAPK